MFKRRKNQLKKSIHFRYTFPGLVQIFLGKMGNTRNLKFVKINLDFAGHLCYTNGVVNDVSMVEHKINSKALNPFFTNSSYDFLKWLNFILAMPKARFAIFVTLCKRIACSYTTAPSIAIAPCQKNSKYPIELVLHPAVSPQPHPLFCL